METRRVSEKVSFRTTTTSILSSSKDDLFRRRQMRHASNNCEKFLIGDETKREFYSPNYPNQYLNHTECIRVLEADEGMLLKLDFRDEFKLEDSPECRFDFLEVRDGKHGYSNLLGKFCGSNFPPEITSKTRYLWLRFNSDENIEGKGFKAVWSMIPRPTYPGVPPETEPCIVNVTGDEAIISHNDVEDKKKLAEKEGIPLDCMWVIRVKEGWKIQLAFPDSNHFKLQRPNECDANFLDVFEEKTDLRSRLKNFCGSIADTVIVKSNLAYVRYYAEPKALNSTFEGVMTAIRDKDSGETTCRSGEYDCEDATCIASILQCNGRVNCRFRWDEDDSTCDEHIRQSRENRLDELGRKSTPRPLSASRTDIRDRSSESPSLEVVPSKELLPPSTVIPEEYTVAYNNKITYNGRDMNDIHQSNNVSNATQERLQESNEEPEMRDNSCQTRESLFEPRLSDTVVTPAFTTFGFRGSQNGTNYHRHHHHHHHHHPQSPQKSHPSPSLSHQSSQQSSQQNSHQQASSQCSGCSPASRGRDGSMGVCPKHNPIPAPPGWSSHELSYPPQHQSGQYQEVTDYPTYQRFQSPKPTGECGTYHQSPKFVRQNTVGSGERYGSSVYGSGQSSAQISGHGSSNVTSSTQHSTSSKSQQQQQQQQIQQQQVPSDPRYKAEAVIEIDQRRPFTRLSPRLDDLPILKPPGDFGAPVFKCKTPSLSWQHCGCPSHSHLPSRRSTITWSALKRCGQDAFYRTWPNRSAKRLPRPQKRTVGTQSSFDGVRSSLGTLRCVSRSIDMTTTTMDQEIGVSIPF
ncbi:hypothetical protein M0802_006276 [Mischocyttarus mexicanus]|nr:hypothetical protein M0802_006276 [Mischocyttarus mexicanus]